MKLYFDIGNTNIKVNLQVKNKQLYFNYSSNNTYSHDSFYKLLPKVIVNNQITKVFITSVVPAQTDVIVAMVKKYWAIKPILIKYPLKTGIKIKVSSPKEVGSDLICLAAFLSSQTDKGILVNLGTATTIIVVENHQLEGVIIAPGLMSSYYALINNASKLADVEIFNHKKLKLGKTTQEALSIGLINGHGKMIQGLVNDLNVNHKLFISGGHSAKVIDFLPGFTLVKEATIAGMKVIEELNHE